MLGAIKPGGFKEVFLPMATGSGTSDRRQSPIFLAKAFYLSRDKNDYFC
jgi:hypothetical protein